MIRIEGMEEKTLEEKKRIKKRNIIIIIVVAVILVLSAIAVSIIFAIKDKLSSADLGSVEAATKRDIEKTVSASGVFDSINSEAISSTHVGSRINAVYVKEGDSVTPGQVICQLDTSALQGTYSALQKTIEQTKADKAKNNQEYDKELLNAQNEWDAELSNINQEIAIAQAACNSTSAELDKQRARYAQYLSDPNHSEWDIEAIEMESNISDLESDLENNQYKVVLYTNVLNALQNSDNSNSSVDEIRNSVNGVIDGSIQAMEEQARELQKSIGEATVRSTAGGVVTSLSAKAGETYVGGTICMVEDANSYMIYSQIGEANVADVSAGMKVKIKTEATGDSVMTGYVTYVAPRASATASSSDAPNSGAALSATLGSSGNYLIKIALDEQNPRIRLGMNAKLKIVTSETPNVLSVPNAAIQDDNGKKYVEVVTNMDDVEKNSSTSYKKEKVYVQVGMSDDNYTQIEGKGIEQGTDVYVPLTLDEETLKNLEKMVSDE